MGTPEAQQAGYDLLSSGGVLVTVLSPDIKNPSEDKRIFQVFGSVHPSSNREFGKILVENVPKLIADGAIVVCYDFLCPSWVVADLLYAPA